MDLKAVCEFYAGKELEALQMKPAEHLVLYVSKGELQISASEENCSVGADRVVLLTDCSDLKLSASEEGECYLLGVYDQALSEMVQHCLTMMDAQDNKIYVVDASKQKSSIRIVFKNLEALACDGAEHSDVLRELLQELLVRVYRASLEVPAKAWVMVTEICKRLDEEYYREFSLEKLAAEYKTSVSYLLHAFKKIHGVPVMRYLLNRRIQEAKECLENSAMPIHDVAKQCGFNDISNFGRTFKKETGYSPRQYRKQFRVME